ncbi:MAG: hypothetical protein HXS50_01685, partial [Theionarchaea archaeon]|nr:hypothetical protein [Theionarchaea archaeon]
MKMDNKLVIVCLLLFTATCNAGVFTPTVYVYSGDMPGFGEGIVEILNGSIEGVEFVAVNDPTLLSSLIPMPDTACAILAVMKGKEVETLITPLLTYFEGGGALIGFQGCMSLNTAGDLATDIFPIFGNATGSFTLKEGVPINEYVRDVSISEFANLPESFNLLGQFFAYSVNSTKGKIDPMPDSGVKRVLYRDKKTEAPLIVAYESEEGSRSISLTGFFVRSTETASNYYGKLLVDPLFADLMIDAVTWTMDGATRSSTYESTYEDLIQDERERAQELIDKAERNRSDAQNRKVLFL